MPRPPRSTLFPYTTLFRSLDALERVEGAYSLLITVGRTLYAIVDPRDRKSTRLNSSHRTISYAVFCLKKKNYRNYRDAVYTMIDEVNTRFAADCEEEPTQV